MNFYQQIYKGKNNWYITVFLVSIVSIPFLLKIYYYLFVKKEVSLIKVDSNLLLTKGLLQYLVFFLVLLVGIKFLHKRPIKSVITSKKDIDWWRYVFGISSWGLFVLIYFSLNYFAYPENYTWNFKPIPFTILFLISFTLVPLGAIFKEVFFTGYLLQVIGFFIQNKIISILITSTIYMLAMGINPVIETIGLQVLLFYFASGLFTSLVTTIDDGLELAMGMQTANNIFALLYITSTWRGLETNALLLDHSEPKVLFLVYIPVFIFFPLYFLLLKQMYQWKNIKDKLLSKITKPVIKNINL